MSTPKLLDRIRNTYKFFRHGNTYPAVYTKRSPYLWPFGVTGQPQWAMVDYESYYTDGFSSNAVIYAAIMVKVRAIAQTNLVPALGTENNPEIIDDTNHPLSVLLSRPNPYQSGSEFNQLQSVFLNLTGNSFTYLVRDRSTSLPSEMWVINPTDVQIIPDDKGGIKGYVYNPTGRLGTDSIPMLPTDVMHVKLPNPLDPLKGLGFGMSPISPLAKSGDVDNNITDFMKMFFQHGAMPSGALKLKELSLDDDSINEIKEKWLQVYGGFNNWSDIAVLDMNMEYERIGMTFKDMDFTNLDQRNESRIMLPFGVPAELLPIRLGLEGSTFANKEEARKWFWEDTMTYEMDLFLDTYKAYLSTDDGSFPIWDTSRVSALRQDVSKLVSSAKELWSMGVPAEIAFSTVGLNVSDYPNIDVGYLPFNVVPVGNNPMQSDTSTQDTSDNTDSSTSTTDNTQNEQDDTDTSVKKKTSKGYTPEQKSLIYKAVDRIALNHEDAFRSAANKAFTYDKRKILSFLSTQKKKSLETKASVNYPAIASDIEAYLSHDSAVNWRNQFLPAMTAEIEDTGKFWSAQLGVQFDLRNIGGESWFTDYTTVFANPITDTSNEVMHGMIQQAMAEGWSIDEMSNHIGDTFDYWMSGDISKVDFDFLTRPAADPRMGNRMLHWRQELIARTETTRLNNAGARNLFTRWGVGKKEWLSTGDDRTRDSHVAMTGQVVAIGEKFKSGLGNELDYPGDPSAPLADTAQCRCTILPVIE